MNKHAAEPLTARNMVVQQQQQVVEEAPLPRDPGLVRGSDTKGWVNGADE